MGGLNMLIYVFWGSIITQCTMLPCRSQCHKPKQDIKYIKYQGHEKIYDSRRSDRNASMNKE